MLNAPSPSFVLLMKCFCWNVRGLNGNTRKSDVKRWIHHNRPMFGSFLETHVQQESLNALVTSYFPGWRFDSNHSADAGNGRIVLMWNPALSVVVYLKSPQMIVCGVFDHASQETFTVCFIYAYNERSQRTTLWNSLRCLAQSTIMQNRPWLLMGDYNQVLSSSEAYSLYSSDISPGGMADLQDCLTDCELFDLAFRGCLFTWSNKSPTSPRSRKLDRALINESWMEKFPNSFAYFDSPRSSDHSPCLVTVKAYEPRRKTRFTYFSFFSSHPDYA